MGRKLIGGISIIELLVVVLVFAVISVLATQTIALSLRGSRKSESSIAVRENLNYALSVMERQLHNAESVSCPSATTIAYNDALSQAADFTCDLGMGFVASSSAQLTGSNVQVMACSFICDPGSPGVPPSVMISITAQDANAVGVEQTQLTTDTRILLRTY